MIRQKFKLLILFVLFLTTVSNKIFAECSDYGINVFPRTKTIFSNPIFIIEGYSSSEFIIHKLNNGHAIYLTSGKVNIPLIVIKTLVGQFGLTQAVLKPSEKLISGKHYKLNIDNLDEFEKEQFENSNIGWTVSNIADNQKPIWSILPSYQSKGMEFYGCGPSAFVNFSMRISDNSPVVVYSKVKNLKTNSSSDYYVTPKPYSIQLGYGMCSGEFRFKAGQEYEATFSLMDASGNISTETNPIKFTGPSEKDEINHEKKVVNKDHQIQKPKRKKTAIWILISLVAIGLVLYLSLKKK